MPDGRLWTSRRPPAWPSSPFGKVAGQWQPPKNLSRREREVLRLLAQGHSNQQIADAIRLSVKTVETYRTRLSEKLGLKGRAELYRFAAESGILDTDPVPPAVGGAKHCVVGSFPDKSPSRGCFPRCPVAARNRKLDRVEIPPACAGQFSERSLTTDRCPVNA